MATVGSLYEEEIENETFYEFEGLVDGLFERAENSDDVRETLARFMQCLSVFYSLVLIYCLL